MTLSLRRARRLLFAVLVLSLLATACGGSSGDTETATTDPAFAADGDEGSGDSADPAEGSAGEAATSIPVPADDDAADEAIAGLDASSGDTEDPAEPADPTESAQGFLRNLFNIDPDPATLECIVGEANDDPALLAALQSPRVASGDVDDAQLRSLTPAINGCVETISLADWATQAVGPQGDVRDTAPPCFAERFDDPADGDLIFSTFVALTYQFRIDPAGGDGLVAALTDCAPITGLTEFFASQEEQGNGFTTLIDRDCLNEVLSPSEVSGEFWEIFVAGGFPPAEFIATFTDQCGMEPEVIEPPTDFTPWSGTGALASVAPAARANIYDAPPPMSIDPAASYTAVLQTAGTEVRIRLFADSAPLTVNNFVSLARDGYYDGTVFHRVLADFMAQGGDPTGTGTGGPGYQFEDEVDGGPALDRKGLLAMANAGPGTNGSQFFITFVPTEWLTGNHTVFGEVIEGMEIIDAIELRDPAAPNGPGQTIDSITIVEG